MILFHYNTITLKTQQKSASFLQNIARFGCKFFHNFLQHAAHSSAAVCKQ